MNIEEHCRVAIKAFKMGSKALEPRDFKCLLMINDPFILWDKNPYGAPLCENYLPIWFLREMRVLTPYIYMLHAARVFLHVYMRNKSLNTITTHPSVMSQNDFDVNMSKIGQHQPNTGDNISDKDFQEWLALFFPEVTWEPRMTAGSVFASHLPYFMYIRMHRNMCFDGIDMNVDLILNGIDATNFLNYTQYMPFRDRPLSLDSEFKSYETCKKTARRKALECMQNTHFAYYPPSRAPRAIPSVRFMQDQFKRSTRVLPDSLPLDDRNYSNTLPYRPQGEHFAAPVSKMVIHNPEPTDLTWKCVGYYAPPNELLVELLSKPGIILSGGTCVRMYYGLPLDADYDIYCRDDEDTIRYVDELLLRKHARFYTRDQIHAYGAPKLIRYAKLPENAAPGNYTNVKLNLEPAGKPELVEPDDDSGICYFARTSMGNCRPKEMFKRLERYVETRTPITNRPGDVHLRFNYTPYITKRVLDTYSVKSRSSYNKKATFEYDVICTTGEPRDFIQKEFDLNVCKMYGVLEDGKIAIYALYPEDLEERKLKFAFDPRMTINGAKLGTILERRSKYVRTYDMEVIEGSTMTVTDINLRKLPVRPRPSDIYIGDYHGRPTDGDYWYRNSYASLMVARYSYALLNGIPVLEHYDNISIHQLSSFQSRYYYDGSVEHLDRGYGGDKDARLNPLVITAKKRLLEL